MTVTETVITEALGRFLTLGYHLYISPVSWCTQTQSFVPSTSKVRKFLWGLCYLEAVCELLATWATMCTFEQIDMKRRMVGALFALCFTFTAVAQLIFYRNFGSMSALIRQYLLFEPLEESGGMPGLRNSRREGICRKIILSCMWVQILHPLAVGTWFLRNSTELRYPYGWIALLYHSEWLVLLGWAFHMWGVAFFVFIFCFSFIGILTYTSICTHWLRLLLKGSGERGQKGFRKMRALIKWFPPKTDFDNNSRHYRCTLPRRMVEKETLAWRIRLYRQLQLTNAAFYTSSLGLLAGLFLSECLVGHALVIVLLTKLYQHMPIPMTLLSLYYFFAITAFELVLVREMGAVKEMSRQLVQRWMGQVSKRSGEWRQIRCLMPFGIKFGSDVQKTTALTYLLLVSKSAKYLILIG